MIWGFVSLIFWMVAKLIILTDWTGIGEVMLEAVKDPSRCRELGVQALLYHVMTASSSTLHSKAERVLKLLTSKAVYSIGDKDNQGKLAS